MIKFDALILIDCWGENWIKSTKPKTTMQFYARLLAFVVKKEFQQIFFCSGYVNNNCDSEKYRTHALFESVYPQHQYVNNLEELRNYLPDNSNVLTGGAAWQVCLHNKPGINFNLLRKFYDVYSHPQIVDSGMYSTKIINEDDFLSDSLIWVPKDNYFFLKPD